MENLTEKSTKISEKKQSIMNLNEFKIQWNSYVKKWYQEYPCYTKSYPFNLLNDNCFLLKEGMPEPYLGDPENCSAVILNINPGGLIKEQCFYNGQFVKDYALNYEKFAIPFPYLSDYASNSIGGKWWNVRKSWIDRIISLRNGNSSSKLPFALEICPWHSKQWKAIDYGKYKDNLNKYVTDIAVQAARSSDLKNIVLSVGKPILNVLCLLDFKEIDLGDFSSKFECYKKPNGKLINRHYSAWKREDSDVIFFNTFSIGSNKVPKESFSEVEQMLLNQLMQHDSLSIKDC